MIRLFVFVEFCPRPKCGKHYTSSTSQKFSKKFFLFYIGGGEKFIKGVFARFRPPQPPGEFHCRKSGGWEAESFLDAWRGWQIPTHPRQSLCSGLNPCGFRLPARKACFPSNFQKHSLIDVNL